MILVFDTETTGLPKNWNAPVTAVSNWPRMVQLAWILYDFEEQEIESHNHIIRPDGFTIPQDAQRVHGISTEQALRDGKELSVVLQFFLNAVERATYLVAHNMSFDERIVGAEMVRLKINVDKNPNLVKICTKEASTTYCQLPGNYGYKWPNLSELHKKLFHTDFKEAHRADVDVRACARCFFELKRRGVIVL